MLQSSSSRRVNFWVDKTTIHALGAYSVTGRNYPKKPVYRKDESFWVWVSSGTLFAHLGPKEERVELKAGDVLFLPRHTLFSLETPRPNGMSMITVHFHANTLGGRDLLQVLGLPSVLQAKQSGPFAELSRQAIEEFQGQPMGWWKSLTALVTLGLMHALRQAEPRLKLPDSGSDEEKLLELHPVFELVERRLKDPDLTVGEMASCLYISEVALRRRFAQSVGISPAAYVQRRRVEKACALLRNSSHPIKEVAFRTGFTELPFFYRAFKKWMRSTPARYRAGEDEL